MATEIRLRAAGTDAALFYGIVYESEGTYDLPVNRPHPHRLQVWNGARRTRGARFAAEALVISAHHASEAPRGTLADGSRIRLIFPDGVTVLGSLVCNLPERSARFVPDADNSGWFTDATPVRAGCDVCGAPGTVTSGVGPNGLPLVRRCYTHRPGRD